MISEINKGLQFLRYQVVVPDEDIFGYFKLDFVSREIGFRGEPFQCFHQTVSLKLPGRNIYRDPQVDARAIPFNRLTAPHFKHMLTKVLDHPGFFTDRYKRIGHNQALHRMVPTHQGLDRGQCPVLHADPRLVKEDELLLLDAAFDICLQQAPRRDPGADFIVEICDPVAATLLGKIQGDIRVSQRRIKFGLSRFECCDAHADGDVYIYR